MSPRLEPRSALGLYPLVYFVPPVGFFCYSAVTHPTPAGVEPGAAILAGALAYFGFAAQLGYVVALLLLHRRLAAARTERIVGFAVSAALGSIAGTAAIVVGGTRSALRTILPPIPDMLSFVVVPVVVPMLMTWLAALLFLRHGHHRVG